MPSDAHELAARHQQEYIKRLQGQIRNLKNDVHHWQTKSATAAAELERLAAENTQLREALAEAHGCIEGRVSTACGNPSCLVHGLSSAGPPQEVSYELPDNELRAMGPQPPPGSGCTYVSPPGMSGMFTGNCTDPACPEHGDPPPERRCTCDNASGQSFRACPVHGR